MTASVSPCPPADVIAAFALGELPAANASVLQLHVSECESCLATVGHLAASSRGESLSSSAPGSDWATAGLWQAGQTIGSYVLVRELGQGGMGEVWEAEQRAPVRRTVALKLLKPGMDTRQIVARFEAERQALALMQHPCIAQIFDAGVTASGRPYFVMERVHGVPITRYCDEAQLDVRERLRLFQQVCDAVQHAHQKGVIHRDIKPSNVLVTMHDGRAVPKVIDFGLARIVVSDQPDATRTEIGTMLGTPAYASPEQMSFGVIDVDTRSDVYSLGVLLYELLVGVVPFGPRGTSPDAMLELRRSIRELDPAPPSKRADARALRRLLRGDLDAVVLKSLEKDRTRRYASPSDLSRETQRVLDHEPVLAASPTALYRLRKFVRRNRVGTAFAAVLFTLVVSFAAVSAVQVRRISAERDRTAAEAAKASSINRFLQDTLGSADPWKTGSDISVRESLRRAGEIVDASFKDQPLVAASVRRTLGKTYLGLGRLDEAEKEVRAALDTRKRLLGPENADVAENLADLANIYEARANYELADQLGQQALAMRTRLLGSAHPLVAETLLDRAELLKKKGEFDPALTAANQALAIRQAVFGAGSSEVAEAVEQVGLIEADGKGDLARGEVLVRRGYDIHRRLFGADDLRTARSASNLASIALYQGKNKEAEALYRAAMDSELRHLGPKHPDTIVDMENLANALARLKRFDESSAIMKDVLAQRRAVLGENNRLVARTMVNIASLFSASGRLQEAQAAFEEALPRFSRAYGPQHPDTAYSIYAFGVLRYKQQNYVDAEKLLRQALVIQERILPVGNTSIADTRLDLGRALIKLRQFDEARTLLTRAHDAYVKAYGADAPDTRDAAAALKEVGEPIQK